ncbi:MAG TPA: GNAT family protein [bacterium]|nr:GNAT family protein [bacterium]
MKSKIIGKRVVLRPLRQSDLPLMVKWMDEPKLARLMEIDISLNENYQNKWFSAYKKDPSKQIYAITIRRSGRHVGNIAVSDLEVKPRHAHLTIFIGSPKDRGKGYAREAMLLFLNHCFNDIGLNRVFLTVRTDNYGAIQLYEYCGFSREGLLRKKKETGKGYSEKYIMAVTKTEFEELKNL